jgi:hypothetical protein
MTRRFLVSLRRNPAGFTQKRGRKRQVVALADAASGRLTGGHERPQVCGPQETLKDPQEIT